jgi:hypothetical protein
MKKYVFMVMLIVFALNVSCLDKDQRNWKKAAGQNTIQSYMDFVNKFPQSALADSAKIKISLIASTLIDSSLFYIVKSTNYNTEYIKKKMDCFAKATQFLETAVSNDSLNSIALNNLAVMYFVLGNKKKSIELFERIPRLDNSDSTKAIWLEILVPSATYPENRDISCNSISLYLCQPANSQNVSVLDSLHIFSTKGNLLLPAYGVCALKQGDKNQDKYQSMFEPKFDESIKGYEAKRFIDMNIHTLFGTFDNPKI